MQRASEQQGRALLLVLVLVLAGLVTAASAEAAGSFVPTGAMGAARLAPTATRLDDGRVLVVGAGLLAAEVYDPGAGAFAATAGSLALARHHLTATLLADGRVLIAGGIFGSPSPAAERYDPVTDTFTATGSLVTPRTFHVAARLLDGRVLVAAGNGYIGSDLIDLASAEIYNPTTEVFSATGGLSAGRRATTATLLLDGTVLVAGGANTTPPMVATFAGAERYNPSTGTFAATGSLNNARHGHVAVRLQDGRVLVAGGLSYNPPAGGIASAEVYDPATGTFTLTGSMSIDRLHADAALLEDGRVLVMGGSSYNAATFVSTPLDTAEVYDPATGLFTPVGDAMSTARYFGIATALADGRVLVTGGYDVGPVQTATADLYVPPPAAADQSVTTAEDTAVPITLADGRARLNPGGARRWKGATCRSANPTPGPS